MFGQRQNPISPNTNKPPIQTVKLDITKDVIGETPTSLENDRHNLPVLVDRGLGSIISRHGGATPKTKAVAPSKNIPRDNQIKTTRLSNNSKTNTSRISEKRLAKRTQKELDKIDRLALPPTKPLKPVLVDNEASFDSDCSVKKAKRGRKTMGADKYVQESEDKINGWKKILKDGKYPNGKILTEDDIAKLKNQISAQRSRANKKMEVKAL